MTFGSKNSANGSSAKCGKTSKSGKGANLATSGIGCGRPSSTYHAPVYGGATSKKSSDGRLKKISQPGINPKGSSRVG